MKPPALRDTVARRLAALEKYQILDTLPEADFDDLAQLAATVCGCSIALICLLDAEREWFKSRWGLETSEVPLGQGFCAHAIAQPDLGTPFIVCDASEDERFARSPLVTGATAVRFYAGQPLAVRDGTAVGTICVLDGTPRPAGLQRSEATALAVIGRQIVAQMELRQTVRHLAAALCEKAAVRAELRELQAQLPACSHCGDTRTARSGRRLAGQSRVQRSPRQTSRDICAACYPLAMAGLEIEPPQGRQRSRPAT